MNTNEALKVIKEGRKALNGIADSILEVNNSVLSDPIKTVLKYSYKRDSLKVLLVIYEAIDVALENQAVDEVKLSKEGLFELRMCKEEMEDTIKDLRKSLG